MHGTSRVITAAVLAAALLGVATARAQSPSPMPVPGRADHGRGGLGAEQKQERQFLREAAAHLRLQHAAAMLALNKSANDHVREVAATLLNHANTAQPEVLHLLHTRGMAMPMLGNEARVLKQLEKASGAKFDRLFMEEVVLRAGQLDAARYERIAPIARDPRLQAWVARQIPVVRYHVALATRTSAGDAAKLARNPAAQPATVGANPSMVTRPPPRVPAPKV